MPESPTSSRKDKIVNTVLTPVHMASKMMPLVRSLSNRSMKLSDDIDPSDDDSEVITSGVPKLNVSSETGAEINEADDETYEDALDDVSIDSGAEEERGVVANDADESDRLSRKDKLTAKMLLSPRVPALSPRRLSMSPLRMISTISKHAPTPITASMSLTKSALTKIPAVITDYGKNETIDSEFDLEGISRSFAGFLTAASVYAGFQDIDDDEEEKVKVLNEQVDETPNEPPAIQIEDDDNETRSTQTEQNGESIFLTITEKPLPRKEDINKQGKDKDAENENKSKFELSIVSQLSKSKSNENEALESRAEALSLKVRDTFGINPDEEFIGDYSCWLLGDVLLQGHLYVTNQNILFFAFLPKKSKGSFAKAGALSTQSFHSLRIHRKWAILRDNTLAIYASSTNLYFPELVIDLRTSLRAELHGVSANMKSNQPVWIKIVTENRTHWFQADNLDAARSWVTILKKYIFSSRNQGDEVAIKIPLQNIIDLELTSIIGVTKNLRIKVIENANSFAIDDYFLMFFSKGNEAIVEIKNAIERAGIKFSNLDDESGSLMDSDLMKSKCEQIKNSSSSVSNSNYRPITDSVKAHDILSDSEDESDSEQPLDPIESKLKKLGRKSIFRSGKRKQEFRKVDNAIVDTTEVQSVEDTTHHLPAPSDKSKWTTKSIVKNIHTFTQRLIFTGPISHFDESFSMEGEDPFYVKDPAQREACNSRFVKRFSLNEKAKLVATYSAYLMKGLPTYGKLYVGDGEICFRSTIPGSNTIMILPIADLENTNKEQGFRFGYYGLVILIHGHEELFFEFSSQEARSDCEVQILKTLDAFKQTQTASIILSERDEPVSVSHISSKFSGSLSSAKVRLFENELNGEVGIDVPIIVEDHPLVKTELKPLNPFKFTLLTIGSRGDVQPYIALGKALLKEGHKVKIVTHIEFKDWIEGHGLEFDRVAGDPSELMALMVSHPTISYSFIKEAKAKFKSWIDDLLTSSWEACQDADVLIESPSSISGIHIAEKLKIPYFRAFTMPWTRTRAYPHAFMVPDQRLGGAYNYMTHVAFENGYWRGTSYQVNKWRVETLGLKKTTLANMELASIPFLYNISPIVFPPSVDFAEWIRVTGYWFLNESSSYDPPEPLVNFMEKARADGKKLVYIGFGSIVVENPKELTQAVVDAVLEADVRCILNKGWSDRLGSSKGKELEITLPDEVYNAGNIPHDWLFTQIDAAVHHGGSGTTGASLKFGLPTIIKPFFGDQKFYANRVEDLGCGVALKTLNSKDLAKALKEVTTNKRIIEKAKLAGELISAENGVEKAIYSIYSMMEYAKKVSVRKAERNNKNDSDGSDGEDVDEVADDKFEKGDGSWLLV